MSHSAIGLGPRRAAPLPPAALCPVAPRCGGVDADHDVADSGGDGRGRVLDVDLVAGPAGHGRLDEGGVDTEVLGKGHGGLGVADAVDVGQRQSCVRQGIEHHRHLELTTEAVELAGRGDVVGDADDRGGAAQAPVHPSSSLTAPRRRPHPCRRRG